MPPDQIGRLRDILTACELITTYIAGVSRDDFDRQMEKQDAIIRRLEIIDEATRHLTPETDAAVPDLPFRRMRGMRNVVAHDYANVDVQIVWEVATEHVPELCRVLKSFFAKRS